MAYEVSARKYRPDRFNSVLGQEHITRTIKNAIISDRIAHAYLFTGPRGVGKTTTARILAKSLNCTSPFEGEPCNECSNCKAIHSGSLMDIVEIDAASNRGIDEVRTIIESVRFASMVAKYKVYIIDEVHMLTKESFNSFLKTLEEPPERTVFIFATTDIHKVPKTIISRCQRFDFRRIPVDIIKQNLNYIAENEGIKIDDKTLTLLAKKSDGGMRDAESYFDQAAAFCGSTVDFEQVVKVFNFIDDTIYFRVSDSIKSRNFAEAFYICDEIYSNGWSYIDFMNGLIEHFRNILSVIAAGSIEFLEADSEQKEEYKKLSKEFSEGDILRILNFLNKIANELRFSQNHKLKVELALSCIIGFENSSQLSSVIEALKKKSLNNGSTQFHAPDNTVTVEQSGASFENETGEQEQTLNQIDSPSVHEPENTFETAPVIASAPIVNEISNEPVSAYIENESPLIDLETLIRIFRTDTALSGFVKKIDKAFLDGNQCKILFKDNKTAKEASGFLNRFEAKLFAKLETPYEVKIINDFENPENESPFNENLKEGENENLLQSGEEHPYVKYIKEKFNAVDWR
ncbi:MAG: DNA polymerase III subunit gamma/tau [Ignavibacteriaceae bacterium]|nr:DNA polymerase III subunit gamma/tau [Ignavibacteriaceae bacterium]